ncbi:RICIN domain-containing protein [Streptomyces sp. NPDC021356]|uniref:RICIN domain-containing protein n=1 Tax=Streptomyces sp. NPDC021356 TaxID=3154900 RepID=UPI0033D15545
MRLEQGGRYVITNRLSGSVIDVKGADNTVCGWEKNGGDSQQWILIDNDGHRFIRNVQSGLYLAPSKPSFDDIHDGTAVVVAPRPFQWDVKEQDDDEYRMYVAGFGRAVNIDLAEGGNPANGTGVVLWGQVDESRNQLWGFERI